MKKYKIEDISVLLFRYGFIQVSLKIKKYAEFKHLNYSVSVFFEEGDVDFIEAVYIDKMAVGEDITNLCKIKFKDISPYVKLELKLESYLGSGRKLTKDEMFDVFYNAHYRNIV